MPVFTLAEEMTAENRIGKGYMGISLGLLRRLTQYELLTIKDMAGKTNSNGESLLGITSQITNGCERVHGRRRNSLLEAPRRSLVIK